MNKNKKPTKPEDSKARDIRISKALSYLLRHGAIKEKLNIDNSGFIAVNELLSHNRLKTHKTTLEDIERIVRENEKQRFKLAEDDTREATNGNNLVICANQGHSIKTITNDNLEPILDASQMPSQVFHGTYSKTLPLINQTGGLKTMTRNHIHLTDNLDYLRKSCDIMIYINVIKCIEDGILFYKSENNVYLTSGIDGVLPVKYFDKVMKRANMQIIDINGLEN